MRKFEQKNEIIVDGEPSFCQYHIAYQIICNVFMALYAVYEDDIIHAKEADPFKTYFCIDCFGLVKMRRGKRFPHFYHLKTAKSCRLYSKTEDHMLAQLQLQKLFPSGTIQLERPFIKIGRVGDAVWEKEKIIFEIQCSPMSDLEAENRIKDYRSLGYEVVWLLDDKRYNKKTLRPAERLLRKFSTYYVSISRGLRSDYYDQFEIFAGKLRVKKGKRMLIDIQRPKTIPRLDFDKKIFPLQVMGLDCRKYFRGSRLDWAIRDFTLSMQNWRSLERILGRDDPKTSRLTLWIQEWIIAPYFRMLDRQIQRYERWY